MSQHAAKGPPTPQDNIYFGKETERARVNFPISLRRLPTPLIRSFGQLKSAAARVNARLGLLSADIADAIANAALEVADGRWDDQFIVDVFQTGSGTSTHMNANEVIACRANEMLTGRGHPKQPVHPNDHVNLGQSSNDVFPTAIHVAALQVLDQQLLPALQTLERRLTEKSEAFRDIVKAGRTHLQDALPVRLGQEFSAYAHSCARSRLHLLERRAALEEVALGGTAVGTGLNTQPEFARQVLAELNQRLQLSVRPAPNYFEALSSRHALVAASGALKTLATDLMKIANDLRLMSSGPRCGFAEIELPELQAGSSMMPGKVNPVLPEAVCQVAAQVIGNDTAITIGAQSGLLELNVMMPLMADNLLSSMSLLTNVMHQFAERCVAGISARRERCRQLADQSLALTTALAPRIGYDRASELARMAYREGLSLRDVAERETDLSHEEIERLLDLDRMSAPHETT